MEPTRRMALAAALVVLLSLPLGAARGQAGPSKEEMARHLQQLQAWFDASDLNRDGYLDGKELAQAFRAAGPAPAAAQAPGAPGPRRGTAPQDVAALLLSLPLPASGVNFTVADVLTRPPGAAAADAGAAPPGQQLLQVVGKSGRGKKQRISRSAFSSWAKKYIRAAHKELKAEQAVQKAEAKVAEVLRAVKQAQAGLKQARTGQAAQKYQKEVARKLKELERATTRLGERRQALAQAAAQFADLSPAIRRALALRP